MVRSVKGSDEFVEMLARKHIDVPGMKRHDANIISDEITPVNLDRVV